MPSERLSGINNKNLKGKMMHCVMFENVFCNESAILHYSLFFLYVVLKILDYEIGILHRKA